MRLSTPAAVLSASNIQQGEGALGAAGAALDATFPAIEATLESGLVITTRSDTFDIGKSDTEYPVLRLTSGLLNRDEPVIVAVYGNSQGISAYGVDYDLGTISLRGGYLAARGAIKITYTHGYEVDSDQLTLKDIPEALRQAGTMKAVAYMLLNPANISKEKARFASVSVNGMEHQTRNALRNYVRPRAPVVWPVYTEVVE